jgi:molybdenum cofactor cytidylyltransferase
MTDPFVAGLVLAAGGKRRLGRPKPLLPYRGATLLDHTLSTARACDFDQLLVAVDSDKVRARVNLAGAEVVPSMAAALDALDPATTVLVVLRGDQPGVVPATVRVLLAARGEAAVAVCRYEDGRGHPYAFGREMFSTLRGEPGLPGSVAAVPVAGDAPPGVESWADYEAVVAAVAGHLSGARLSSRRSSREAPLSVVSTGGWRRGLRD